MRIGKKFLCAAMVFGFASAANADSIQSGIAAYEALDCKPVVEDYLDRKSIDRSQIKVIDYVTDYLQGSEVGDEKEYEAWVSFNSCKGNLTIIMDRDCYIERDYLTNECRAKGAPTK